MSIYAADFIWQITVNWWSCIFHFVWCDTRKSMVYLHDILIWFIGQVYDVYIMIGSHQSTVGDKRGCKAFFGLVGNSAQDSEAFTIVVRTGASWSWHCLSSHVGIGSRACDFVGDELIIVRISASETTLNCSKEIPQIWKNCLGLDPLMNSMMSQGCFESIQFFH